MKMFDLLNKMYEFWNKQGCTRILPYNIAIGAATFHPMCFFGALGKEPRNLVYIQPSQRRADARYGESPNRLLNHHQLQVVMKPIPSNIHEILFDCLRYIGIDEKHHIQLIENNWESESLAAFGKGWEVVCNKMEICQFTYFQTVGNQRLDVPCVELAFGFERCALYALNHDSIFEDTCMWDQGDSYHKMFYEQEKQFSRWFLELNSVNLDEEFKKLYADAIMLLEKNLYLVAYDKFLEMNNVFNGADAMGLITEFHRKTYIDKMKEISSQCASKFLRCMDECRIDN